MRRLRVLLDANVIVDAQARDFFCSLSQRGVIDVRWSAEILDEARRALITKMKYDAAKITRLIKVLQTAFPEASIGEYRHLVETLVLPDSDDRHVLAAALHGECDLLVTNNIGDFPDDSVGGGDLLIATVDEALVFVLGAYPEEVVASTHSQISRLRQPPTTTREFIDRFVQRAPMGGLLLGAAMGFDDYARMVEDMSDAERADGPQSAVRRLLDAVDSQDAEAVVELLDPHLARSVAGVEHPSPASVLNAMTDRLRDVREKDGWGFGTARRILRPDVELVKLIRAGDQARVAFSPEPVEGHLFFLRFQNDRWIIEDLDGDDPALVDLGDDGGTQIA